MKYTKKRKKKKRKLKTRHYKKVFRQKGGGASDCPPDPFGGALGAISGALNDGLDVVTSGFGLF